MQSAYVRGMGLIALSILALAAWTARVSAAEATDNSATTIRMSDSGSTDESSAAATQSKNSDNSNPAKDDRASKAADKDKGRSNDAIPLVNGPADARSASGTPTPAKRQASAAAKPAGKSAQDAAQAKPGGGDEPLKPIPESESNESADAAPADGPAPDAKPVPIEAASFKGVIPGVSTKADVEKAWGTPISNAKQADGLAQLYAVAPFKHVEVNYAADNKVASVVIRFDKAFPVPAVAKQLALTQIRPVLVSSDLGEALGLAYPERGVLLAFEPSKEPSKEPGKEAAKEPGKPAMKVTQIVLDPIAAEPFLLRAETTLDRQPEASRRDLEQALALEHDNARGQWLYSRVLTTAEDYAKALQAAGEAERLEPKNAHYRITLRPDSRPVGPIDRGPARGAKSGGARRAAAAPAGPRALLAGRPAGLRRQARLSQSRRLPHAGHSGIRSAD